MSVRFEMRLPDQVASAVDAVRGDVPRAKWVLRAVEARLDRAEPLEVAVARGPAMTPEELDPYFDAIQERVKPSKEQLAAQDPMSLDAQVLAKGVKPMVFCTVCDRSSASTKWGCPEHGYGKVKPYKERS